MKYLAPEIHPSITVSVYEAVQLLTQAKNIATDVNQQVHVVYLDRVIEGLLSHVSMHQKVHV